MRAPTILLGLASVGLPAQDTESGWRDLTGKPVPEIFAQTWLNTDGQAPSTQSLKGKVWLVEFFATW